MRQALPIGYVELQDSWTGEFDRIDASQRYANVLAKAAAEYPGYVVHGSRCETSRDGAGMQHYTYYVGFVPKHTAAEPLNPNNLNDAALPTIGNPTTEFMIGAKEQRF